MGESLAVTKELDPVYTTNMSLCCNYQTNTDTQSVPISTMLTEWREGWTMDKYLGACRTENQNNYTAANLFAGGGLCTMGEARAGFDPIWSAECVGEKQMQPTRKGGRRY